MNTADNILFLMTVNHVWTKARIRHVYECGFAIKEVCLVEMPESFPQSDFQLGAIHIARGWRGPIQFSDISVKESIPRRRKSIRLRDSGNQSARCPNASRP